MQDDWYTHRMEIAFRPLDPADLPAAAALWHEGWHAGHAGVVPEALTRLRTLESFRDRLTRYLGETRVAMRGDDLVGFAILLADEIYQFYVGSEARGTDAAQALMVEAETLLRASGNKRAWLACSVGNSRAARFYEKAGWRRVRTETMTFETSDGPFPLDIWRYEKPL